MSVEVKEELNPVKVKTETEPIGQENVQKNINPSACVVIKVEDTEEKPSTSLKKKTPTMKAKRATITEKAVKRRRKQLEAMYKNTAKKVRSAVYVKSLTKELPKGAQKRRMALVKQGVAWTKATVLATIHTKFAKNVKKANSVETIPSGSDEPEEKPKKKKEKKPKKPKIPTREKHTNFLLRSGYALEEIGDLSASELSRMVKDEKEERKQRILERKQMKPLCKLNGSGRKRFRILIKKGYDLEQATELAKLPMSFLVEKFGNGTRILSSHQIVKKLAPTDPTQQRSPFYWQRPGLNKTAASEEKPKRAPLLATPSAGNGPEFSRNATGNSDGRRARMNERQSGVSQRGNGYNAYDSSYNRDDSRGCSSSSRDRHREQNGNRYDRGYSDNSINGQRDDCGWYEDNEPTSSMNQRSGNQNRYSANQSNQANHNSQYNGPPSCNDTNLQALFENCSSNGLRFQVLISNGCSYDEAMRIIKMGMNSCENQRNSAPEQAEESLFSRDRSGPQSNSNWEASSTGGQSWQSSNQFQSRGQNDYQSTPIYSGYFCCNCDTPTDTILRTIKLQNRILLVEQWRILNRDELSSGVELTFGVDRQSRECIENWNRVVKFGTGMVQLALQN